MAKIPPDPAPWIERPSNNTVNECAIPLTIVPTVNSKRTRKSKGFLPKTWDNDANVGWKTVAQSKKAVPAQKPSRAEPWSFSVTICFGIVNYIQLAWSSGLPTGMAGDSEVVASPSNHAMTPRLESASQKALPFIGFMPWTSTAVTGAVSISRTPPNSGVVYDRSVYLRFQIHTKAHQEFVRHGSIEFQV